MGPIVHNKPPPVSVLVALDIKENVIELNCCSVACVPSGNVGPTTTVEATAVAR